eukprot:10726432-Ditylum_brightwellii.AAC.1
MANTAQAVMILLDYAATNPDAEIRFRHSNMILHIHSNASYISNKRPKVGQQDILSWGRESGQDQQTGVGPCQNLEMCYGLRSRSRMQQFL